jgi:uncharacterized pyridoxal phosphate-dependent enzyme
VASSRITRRGLLRSTAAVAAVEAAGLPAQMADAAPLEVGASLYQSIGVTPVVNCRGTFTIISGSQTLPEVKKAMELASHSYIHLDELMEAVGRRLAELTQAEWGMVTAGCAAALTHATSACITGGDPEKMQRMPDLTGLKNEVVVPRYSRNVYDHAVRMTGVKMVEADSAQQFESAINAQTAMVMILSCPAAEKGELSIPAACAIARRKGVPVIVDAAAEELTIPNIHLRHGASMVAYSGGKCLRGPQAAGLLLGQKDLLQTAWVNSAPHHAFGRSLKVGKEEIMGMLAAVEMWVKRDHEAEWREWQSWLDHISDQAMKVAGVSRQILQPEDLSNHAPVLQLSWDARRVGITGAEVEELLLNGSPRIVVAGSSGNRRDMSHPSTLRVMPYMMQAGDYRIASEAIYKILSNPPKIAAPEIPAPSVNVAGVWAAELKFLTGSARHEFTIAQTEEKLTGTHKGETLAGSLNGSVEGNRVQMRSSQRIQGTSLSFRFAGTASGDSMQGTVDLGEYGKAQFTARRT